MNIRLLLMMIFSVFIACNKSSDDNEYYSITGQVKDWDDRSPITGAKVYLNLSFPNAEDSAVSDASGRVSFRLRKDAGNKKLSAVKPGYLVPFYLNAIIPPARDRTDTIFLARPSYLNIITQRTGTYLPTDLIRMKITGYPPFLVFGIGMPSLSNYYEFQRPANAADTILNLPFVYYPPPNQKAYLTWEILRAGNTISTQSDSTTLLQFSTKNYILNY